MPTRIIYTGIGVGGCSGARAGLDRHVARVYFIVMRYLLWTALQGVTQRLILRRRRRRPRTRSRALPEPGHRALQY